MDNGTRVAFVSMDGERHHTIALFEDGEKLPSGNSRMRGTGLHHIAMPVDSRDDVDKWQKELEEKGVKTAGPSIQGPEGWRAGKRQRQLFDLLPGPQRHLF